LCFIYYLCSHEDLLREALAVPFRNEEVVRDVATFQDELHAWSDALLRGDTNRYDARHLKMSQGFPASFLEEQVKISRDVIKICRVAMNDARRSGLVDNLLELKSIFKGGFCESKNRERWGAQVLKYAPELDVSFGREMLGADSSVACVQVQDFISEQTCRTMLEAVYDVGFDYHRGDNKSGQSVLKGKLGPNLYRYKDDVSLYFELVRKFRTIFTEKIFKEYNPFESLVELCRSAFDVECTCIAKEGDSEFIPFTVRDLSEAAPHTDWVKTDYPQLELAQCVEEQFAWNIYLDVPEYGGQTVAYKQDVRCNPREELSSYAPRISIVPKRGSLLVLKSTNYHEVVQSRGAGKRITLSGFFGFRSSELVFWV